MTDNVDIPNGKDIPPEIYHYIRISPEGKTYLPVVFIDELSMRLRDLSKVSFITVLIFYRVFNHRKA